MCRGVGRSFGRLCGWYSEWLSACLWLVSSLIWKERSALSSFASESKLARETPSNLFVYVCGWVCRLVDAYTRDRVAQGKAILTPCIDN